MKLTGYVLVVLAGFAAIAAGWIYQSSIQPQISDAELDIPLDIDYYLSGVNYRSLSQTGQLDFELRSPYLEHYKLEDISRITTPEMKIVRNGLLWHGRAQVAELSHETDVIELIDEVVFERSGEEPVKMLTNLLSFDSSNDIVISKNGVEILSGKAKINADSGVFDLNQNIYSLTRANAVYYP